MTQIGMSQTQLDEIELRLVGLDHRPWVLDRSIRDENGRALVCKASKRTRESVRYRQDLSVATASETQRLPVAQLALFKLCGDSTEDMGEFVAHAPEDMQLLLDEVKRLRKRGREAEVERDDLRKEALSLRVEKAALQEKLSGLRRLLRDLKREMDAS